jgi:hypothetical protein
MMVEVLEKKYTFIFNGLDILALVVCLSRAG